MKDDTPENNVINIRELGALLAVSLDSNYQSGMESLLDICNQVPEDTFFDATVEELFKGRPIIFNHQSQQKTVTLTSEKFLKSADEFREMYPDTFAQIGFSDGYIPAVGTKILLGALFGWAHVSTDIGDEFRAYL